MTNHSQIKLNIARAIRDDDEVRSWCISHFGRGALVIVDWFGSQGAPGVRESPFVFVYSAAENDAGMVDEETFDVHVVVGGQSSASTPARREETARTSDANGLVVNGIAAELEELRNIVERVILGADVGAVPRTFTRVESSTSEWPLEWAKLNVSYFEPETL